MFKMHISKHKLCRCALLITSALLFITSLVEFIVILNFEKIFWQQIRKHSTFLPGSMMFENWKNSSVHSYVKFYVFNITNVEQILEYDAKPHVKQIGPFTYKISKKYSGFSFSKENPAEWLTYSETSNYEFQPQMSIANPKRVHVTIPNVEFYGVNEYSSWLASMYKPFRSMTVYHVLVDRTFIYGQIALQTKLKKGSKQKLTINTGAYDINDVGRIGKCENISEWDIWYTREANRFKGVGGFRSGNNLAIGDKMTVYAHDICRDLYFEALKLKSSESYAELKLLEYRLIMKDPSDDFQERKFCDPDNHCPPKGVIDLKECLMKKKTTIPAFISLPHFFGGDPRLRHAIDGLEEPNEKEHATYLSIEPITGITMEAKQRIQMGMFLYNENSYFKKMTGPYYLPVFWMSTESGCTKEQAVSLKETITYMRTTLPSLLYLGSLVGVNSALLLFAVYFIYSCLTKQSYCPPPFICDCSFKHPKLIYQNCSNNNLVEHNKIIPDDSSGSIDMSLNSYNNITNGAVRSINDL